MAFAIPKLQYKNYSSLGTTTNTSNVLTAVADTSNLEEGMFAKGTGIPLGAVIVSFTADTVTLDKNATADHADETVSFGFEIEFDYPPKEAGGELLEANSTTSVSLSGIRQVSTNYVEGNRKMIFSFLSPAIYALLDTFLKDWGLYGKTFRYFEDKTLTSYVEYELDTLKTNPKKIAPRGVDTYVWEVPLNFRRVL